MCYNARSSCDFQDPYDVLKLLIHSGVDVNEDVSKYKALNYVTEKGLIEFIKFLIDAGANVNGVDKDLSTPLHKSTSSRKFFCYFLKFIENI